LNREKNTCSTTTCVSLVLPKELPSIEAALKFFAVSSGLSGTVLGIFVGKVSKEKKQFFFHPVFFLPNRTK
jgi:hypothetical protein